MSSLCWLTALGGLASCAGLEETSAYGEEPVDTTTSDSTSGGGSDSSSTTMGSAAVVTATIGASSTTTSSGGAASTSTDGGAQASTADVSTASATTGSGESTTATTTTSTTSATTTTSAGGATSTMAAVTMASVTMASNTTGSSTTGGMPVNACGTTAPAAAIYDFNDYSSGAYDGGNYSGNTFTYSGDNTTINASASGGAVALSGTNNNYAGFGLSFETCVDASGYSGVAFDIGGTAGGGEAVFQLRTRANVPTANNGNCASDCANAQAVYTVPSSSGAVQIPWSSFTGGTPVAGANSGGDVMGFQWQFHCATDGACAYDVTLDNVRFY